MASKIESMYIMYWGHYYFTVMQGRVKLYIRVEDYDRLSRDDHVDDVYVDIATHPSNRFSSRWAYGGVRGNSRIEMNFRVRCTNNYYGGNCATYCRSRDDSLGHYTCGSNGQKICRRGWSDPSNSCKRRKSLPLQFYIFQYTNLLSCSCMQKRVSRIL